LKYLSVFIVLLFFAMVSCGVLLSSCATIPRDDSISGAYLNSGYDHTHRRRYKSYKEQLKRWYKNQTEASRNSPYYGVGHFINTLTLESLRKKADEEDDRNREIRAIRSQNFRTEN
jgi:hypothetical protein